MAIQIQLRRGTASAWTAANPVLAQGEVGLETDTGKIKAGDGAAAWNSLDYTIGAQGLQGVQGVTGDLGPQGPQGVQGDASTVPGPQGNQGFQGTQGAPSTAQGPQGDQGFQGQTGAGTQGNQGYQGADGVQGNQGYQGQTGAGTQGNQGSQGNAGGAGSQGNQGNQGAQGAGGGTGSQGNQGNQGNQGAVGAGSQGNQGDQGAQGSAGVGNLTYYSVQGNQVTCAAQTVTNIFTPITVAASTTYEYYAVIGMQPAAGTQGVQMGIQCSVGGATVEGRVMGPQTVSADKSYRQIAQGNGTLPIQNVAGAQSVVLTGIIITPAGSPAIGVQAKGVQSSQAWYAKPNCYLCLVKTS